MKWHDLKDKPIVSVSGGEKLGFVDDLYLDPSGRQILGLRSRSGGLITHRAAMSLDSLQAVGEDALTVKDASVLNDEGSFSDLKSSRLAERLVGTQVLTESGKELGNIADLRLDLPAGRVSDLELGVGLIDRVRGEEHLIPTTAIRSIGTDAVVVESSAVTSAS